MNDLGKRSSFARNPRDYYVTSRPAVIPLVPHLEKDFIFCEPFAGNGALIDHLESFGGKCLMKSDIEPQRSDIPMVDFFDIEQFPFPVISNPPWDRAILHPIIDKLLEEKNHFWLLFDADWAHTKQSREYMPFCQKIVSVGRVKWIPESKMTGKDNCCWYQFSPEKRYSTEFFGRI